MSAVFTIQCPGLLTMPACQVVTPLALLLTSPNHMLEDTTYNIEVEQSQPRAKGKKYRYKIDQNVFCLTHSLLKMYIEFWSILRTKMSLLVSLHVFLSQVIQCSRPKLV